MEKNSMPLSVLLAICDEMNHYRESQMIAARDWIDLDDSFTELLWKAAQHIPDMGTRNWIYEELYGANLPTAPQHDE